MKCSAQEVTGEEDRNFERVKAEDGDASGRFTWGMISRMLLLDTLTSSNSSPLC